MVSSISFITTCKGRLEHLVETLPCLVAQPGTETILVDYDCPDRAADWTNLNFPAVKVVRVEQQPYFNAARARNRGAAAATAPWLCFVDADTLVAPGFAETVLPVLDPGAYFQCVHGRHELVGSVVLPRTVFEAIQGYDEVIEGWGAEDRDLYHRLERLGLRREELAPHLLDTIKHGAELRTRFHRVKDRMTVWVINRMYLEVKHGMQALIGQDAPTEVRSRIYREIEAEVLAARAAGRQPTFTLSEGWRPFVSKHEVERILTVRMRPVPSSSGRS